jgi:K+-transporting ATPase KdpF subunit
VGFSPEKEALTVTSAILLALAAAVIAYLLYVIIHPEKF